MKTKTIFLDRDGVINHEVGYLHKIKDFKFIEGVFETCLYFKSLGFEIIVITNQSGIARNYYGEQEFHEVNNWMLNQFKLKGVEILDVFYCPHSPNDSCDCRKPKPGMFLQAKKKYNIDMSNSWMIGDKEDDINAAISAGISQTILVRSGHKIDEYNTNSAYVVDSIQSAKSVIKD